MAYPVAESIPSHSGNLTPTLFAPQMLSYFYASTVLAEIANTDYEGQISKYGDKVIIRTLPTITIGDYVKGTDLSYSYLEPGTVELLIDKGKYWAFKVSEVDLKQADIKFVQKWADHAAQTQKVTIETAIFADIDDDADDANLGAEAGAISGDINLGDGTTALTLTADNVIDTIVDAGVVLDEQNVPAEDRWMILPAWACGKLKKSDIQNASITGDGKSVLRTGRLGMVDRFTIYQSNCLPVAEGVTSALFGQKSALTFASQIVHTESLRNQDDFGDIWRGLQVYGYKVVQPTALGTMLITPTEPAEG
jgi:hypothetical protein